MVNLLRLKKKDELSKSLLDSSQDQSALVGKKSKANVGIRSDKPGKTSTTSAKDLWATAASTLPHSPLPTPDKDEHSAPILSVTIDHGKIHLTSNRRNYKNFANENESMDEHTEYSDLTDNRTLKHMYAKKEVYEEALRKAELLLNESSGDKGKAVQGHKYNAEEYSASTQEREVNPEGKGFLSELLSMMDNACNPSRANSHENADDDVPQWGVAPYREQEDNRKFGTSMKDHIRADSYGIVKSARKSSIESSPMSNHENFEMVLEELEEDDVDTQLTKRTAWKNPFNRKRTDDCVVESDQPRGIAGVDGGKPAKLKTPSDHIDIKEKVKRALFPELTDDPVELLRPDHTERIDDCKRKKYIDDSGLEVLPSVESGKKKRFKGRIFKACRRKKSRSSALDSVPEEPQPPHSSVDRSFSKPCSQKNLGKVKLHSVKKQVVENIYKDLLSSDKAFQGNNASLKKHKTEQSIELNKYEKASSTTPKKSLTKTNLATGNDESGSKVDHIMRAAVADTVDAVHPKDSLPSDVQRMDNELTHGLQKSKSWKENSEKQIKDDPIGVNLKLKRSLSAPKNILDNDNKRKKPIWKEVKDPVSGRSYFYHRKTRQTTWTRPNAIEMARDEEELGTRVRKQENEDAERKQSPNTRLRQFREGQGRHLVEGNRLVLKNAAHDFDRSVRSLKQEIAAILHSMGPPNEYRLDELMAQYEGREEELLCRVRNMKDSRPFDEPLVEDDDLVSCNEEEDVVGDLASANGPGLNTSGMSDAHNFSYSRTRSGVTSKQSESTQQITNTRSRNQQRSEIDDRTSGGTNSSSQRIDSFSRVPSKIPVSVRSREQLSEGYSADRITEAYNGEIQNVQSGKNEEVLRTESLAAPGHRENSAAPIVEEAGDDCDNSYGLNDSISALSMNEMEFSQPRKEGIDIARRRALDDAIRREDWDMAASISEGLRVVKHVDNLKSHKEPQDWEQSELDKFISENDWGAVSQHIADLRSKARKAKSDRIVFESYPPVEKETHSNANLSHSQAEATACIAESPTPEFTNEFDDANKDRKSHRARRYDDRMSSSDESHSGYFEDYTSESSRSTLQIRDSRSTSRRRRRNFADNIPASSSPQALLDT